MGNELNPQKTIVLVGCGKAKLDDTAAAFRLYDSSYAEKKMGVAMFVGQPYIISAKHGLTEVTERIEPYEKSLHDCPIAERREWGRDVVESLPDHYENIVFLAGKKYRNPIMEALDGSWTVYSPFEAHGGSGKQAQWLGEAFDQLAAGASFSEVNPNE